MKIRSPSWILAAACAACLTVPLEASARNPSDSRHPDPRGRVEATRHPRRSRSRHCAPPPQVYYAPPPQVVHYPQPVYYQPQPVYYAPPPVVYCPPPAIVYPVRPGLHLVLSF
jgi:hypothetical protein